MALDKQIIGEAARKYGISPKILWGLYGTETNFGKNASTSSAGAVGPFQFLPSTARGMGVNPYDFRSAAFGAAKYLSQYKARGVGGMLSAYNAGPAGAYQPGYVASTLKNAATYGGAGGAQIPVSLPGSGSQSASAAIQVPTQGFDQAGYEKARKGAILGKLIAGSEGSRNNPLFAAGLLSTKPPERSEYVTQGTKTVAGATIPSLPGASTSIPGVGTPTQAPASGAKKVPPPVSVKLPNYLTGKGYPAVEKAKAALEKAEHHPVGIPELTKQVNEGANAPHAQVIPAGHGHVVKTQHGPIYVPAKLRRRAS